MAGLLIYAHTALIQRRVTTRHGLALWEEGQREGGKKERQKEWKENTLGKRERKGQGIDFVSLSKAITGISQGSIFAGLQQWLDLADGIVTPLWN